MTPKIIVKDRVGAAVSSRLTKDRSEPSLIVLEAPPSRFPVYDESCCDFFLVKHNPR